MFKRFFLQRRLDKLTDMMSKHEHHTSAYHQIERVWLETWRQLQVVSK